RNRDAVLLDGAAGVAGGFGRAGGGLERLAAVVGHVVVLLDDLQLAGNRFGTIGENGVADQADRRAVAERPVRDRGALLRNGSAVGGDEVFEAITVQRAEDRALLGDVDAAVRIAGHGPEARVID